MHFECALVAVKQHIHLWRKQGRYPLIWGAADAGESYSLSVLHILTCTLSLSLCGNCASRSPIQMVNYLRSFILTGPKSYAPLLEKRLNRCYGSTGRQWPPSFLELQAAKIGTTQIPLVVRMPDSRTVTVNVDPATSCAEVCKDVIAGLKLKDTYGFGLAVEMGEEVST